MPYHSDEYQIIQKDEGGAHHNKIEQNMHKLAHKDHKMKYLQDLRMVHWNIIQENQVD